VNEVVQIVSKLTSYISWPRNQLKSSQQIIRDLAKLVQKKKKIKKKSKKKKKKTHQKNWLTNLNSGKHELET